jgi:hypothetical protein
MITSDHQCLIYCCQWTSAWIIYSVSLTFMEETMTSLWYTAFPPQTSCTALESHMGFFHIRFQFWCTDAGRYQIMNLKIFSRHFTVFFCRTGTVETENDCTAFSGKDWHTSDTEFKTTASSCCPHMCSVQDFWNPFVPCLLLLSSASVFDLVFMLLFLSIDTLARVHGKDTVYSIWGLLLQK